MDTLPEDIENIIYDYKEQLCRSSILLEVAFKALVMKCKRWNKYKVRNDEYKEKLKNANMDGQCYGEIIIQYMNTMEEMIVVGEDYDETIMAFRTEILKKFVGCEGERVYNDCLNKLLLMRNNVDF